MIPAGVAVARNTKNVTTHRTGITSGPELTTPPARPPPERDKTGEFHLILQYIIWSKRLPPDYGKS
jgi:hypothetical protein